MALGKPELVSHDLCPYVQRAVITLIEKDVPHDRTYIDLSDKPEWFKAISPLGKVPLLKVGDRVLFESAVICEYLDEATPGSLHPSDALERAAHRAWIEFASGILQDIAGFYGAPDAAAFEAKRARITDKAAWLERYLGEGPYFAGAAFSLVDAAYGPVFRYFDVFDRIDDFGFFAKTPGLRAWRAALGRRASVQAAVASDYPELLRDFLARRGSYLSSLIAG